MHFFCAQKKPLHYETTSTRYAGFNKAAKQQLSVVNCFRRGESIVSCGIVFRSFLLSVLHFATHVDNESVEEIAQELVAARLVFRMIFFSENRAQLTCCYFEVNKLHDLNDLVVSQVKGNA
jgi:hypothetical protein